MKDIEIIEFYMRIFQSYPAADSVIEAAKRMNKRIEELENKCKKCYVREQYDNEQAGRNW